MYGMKENKCHQNQWTCFSAKREPNVGKTTPNKCFKQPTFCNHKSYYSFKPTEPSYTPKPLIKNSIHISDQQRTDKTLILFIWIELLLQLQVKGT